MVNPFAARARASSAVPRRPCFSRDESWPTESRPELLTFERAPSVPVGEEANDPRLRGFMNKRHSTSRGVAPRFVWCDDIKGRLHYAHGAPCTVAGSSWLSRSVDSHACHSQYTKGSVIAKASRHATVAVPLQEVTGVRPLAGDGHWIEISWPMNKLVLQTRGEPDRERWVGAIESRAAHWRRKAELEAAYVPSATPIFGASEHGPPAAHWRVKGLQQFRSGW